jgi:GTPase SAR1 family protein
MLKNTREGVKIILIGNKCDMQFRREVNSEIAEAMAINHGLKYFETSAKENINLDKVFYEISRDIFSEVNINRYVKIWLIIRYKLRIICLFFRIFNRKIL